MTTPRIAPWLAALALWMGACEEPAQPDFPTTPEAPTRLAPAEAPLRLEAPAGSPSLHDLELPLETHDQRSLTLGDLAGHPVIISMFYATCPAVCPTLIRDIRAIDEALDPITRARVRVLLVTFDPVADTPARLRRLADNHGVDRARWTLARAEDEEATRALATALGIRYRAVEDGHFNHSTIITLLDPQGRPVSQLDGLGRDPAAILDRLSRARPRAPETRR